MSAQPDSPEGLISVEKDASKLEEIHQTVESILAKAQLTPQQTELLMSALQPMFKVLITLGEEQLQSIIHDMVSASTTMLPIIDLDAERQIRRAEAETKTVEQINQEINLGVDAAGKAVEFAGKTLVELYRDGAARFINFLNTNKPEATADIIAAMLDKGIQLDLTQLPFSALLKIKLKPGWLATKELVSLVARHIIDDLFSAGLHSDKDTLIFYPKNELSQDEESRIGRRFSSNYILVSCRNLKTKFPTVEALRQMLAPIIETTATQITQDKLGNSMSLIYEVQQGVSMVVQGFCDGYESVSEDYHADSPQLWPYRRMFGSSRSLNPHANIGRLVGLAELRSHLPTSPAAIYLDNSQLAFLPTADLKEIQSKDSQLVQQLAAQVVGIEPAQVERYLQNLDGLPSTPISLVTALNHTFTTTDGKLKILINSVDVEARANAQATEVNKKIVEVIERFKENMVEFEAEYHNIPQVAQIHAIAKWIDKLTKDETINFDTKIKWTNGRFDRGDASIVAMMPLELAGIVKLWSPKPEKVRDLIDLLNTLEANIQTKLAQDAKDPATIVGGFISRINVYKQQLRDIAIEMLKNSFVPIDLPLLGEVKLNKQAVPTISISFYDLLKKELPQELVKFTTDIDRHIFGGYAVRSLGKTVTDGLKDYFASVKETDAQLLAPLTNIPQLTQVFTAELQVTFTHIMAQLAKSEPATSPILQLGAAELSYLNQEDELDNLWRKVVLQLITNWTQSGKRPSSEEMVTVITNAVKEIPK